MLIEFKHGYLCGKSSAAIIERGDASWCSSEDEIFICKHHVLQGHYCEHCGKNI